MGNYKNLNTITPRFSGFITVETNVNDGQGLDTTECYSVSTQTLAHSGPKGQMSIKVAHQSFLGGRAVKEHT